MLSRTPARTRPRKFDYDLARAMHDDGVSLRDLAEFFGVTNPAVYNGIKKAEYEETGVWTGPPSQKPEGTRYYQSRD